jgi:NTE family protein
MDTIKTYFTSIKNTLLKKENLDNYKIITLKDEKNKKIFLICDNNDTQLNSQTLFKLLELNDSNKSILLKLLDNNYRFIQNVNNISNLLDEKEIFFNFDPYNNFLLSNIYGINEINEIINRTTNIRKINIDNLDFSKMINPYGLEKVVFTGGGTKGIIYIGALLGLFATGQLFYLNHYSGTSIGALTSMITGCITSSSVMYDIIKNTKLKDILQDDKLINRYKKAINFTVDSLYHRNIDTFYKPPTYTMYGMWSIIDKIVKNNGLYDLKSSGFYIFYALICKKVCNIMGNGLDLLIEVKNKEGEFIELDNEKNLVIYKHKNIPNKTIIKKSINTNASTINIRDNIDDMDKWIGNNVLDNFGNNVVDIENFEDDITEKIIIDIKKENFEGWTIENFFTFDEYHKYTGKTIVFTGTKTSKIETVYYTHTNKNYSKLSVLDACLASMSIPWIIKAPIIDGSYNLDGGIFDNYPLEHCDKRDTNKITHYNNKIFGYLIDDQMSIIDSYEILRELWLSYYGFIDITNICYLEESKDYVKISELFFEIRSEFYKLLYYTNTDIDTFLSNNTQNIDNFNINDLIEIMNKLKKTHNFNLVKKGKTFIIKHLRILEKHYKEIDKTIRIGKKTSLTDIIKLSLVHGNSYNSLINVIKSDLDLIKNMTKTNDLIIKYKNILEKLVCNILAYYELKSTFIKNNEVNSLCEYFSIIMKNLYKKLVEFEKLTNSSVIEINKTKKENKITNYINSHIQISLTMINKILTRSDNSNIDLTDIDLDRNKSSYRKVIDYFCHTDMTGILYKYMCIANDKICNDNFNNMRTIKLNTFETSTLHFGMDDEIKSRLIYEGYSKTIKYFVNILRIMELTGRTRTNEEYIETYEIKFKKLLNKSIL